MVHLLMLAITSLRQALICSVTSLPLSASLTVTIHLSLRFSPIMAFNDTVGWIGDFTMTYFQCNPYKQSKMISYYHLIMILTRSPEAYICTAMTGYNISQSGLNVENTQLRRSTQNASSRRQSQTKMHCTKLVYHTSN